MDRRNRKMDPTERKITKIAREAGKFTVQAMKEEGIGTAEFDFIHLVRHHPGITQTEVREQLKIDKGAAARRAASLEAKGYLIRKPNPWDGRSQLLYATEKAETFKSVLPNDLYLIASSPQKYSGWSLHSVHRALISKARYSELRLHAG